MMRRLSVRARLWLALAALAAAVLTLGAISWVTLGQATGRLDRLQGNDERDLPEGAVFEMRTPGGGGWGEA